MKLLALFATVTAVVLAAPAAASAATEYEGTVVSVNRDNRTFRLHDSERGTIRNKVNSRTRYERVAGFAGLSVGQRAIEVTTRRKIDGAWIAIEVEKSGGGGEHGGRDDDD